MQEYDSWRLWIACLSVKNVNILDARCSVGGCLIILHMRVAVWLCRMDMSRRIETRPGCIGRPMQISFGLPYF